MWTAASLTLTHVWDDVLWRLTASWQDDQESEVVVLVREGSAPLRGAETPVEQMRTVLAAIAAANPFDSVAPRA